ncbi:MAG TPA: YciI family protein [Bacteroidales bacterium]|nr:YciI family protein [Bacteroidales bacterium]
MAKQLGADVYGNSAFTFVMLRTGSVVENNKQIRDSLFAGHMANMGVMAEAGKLVLAGPFNSKNKDQFRGIFIINSTDTTEVRTLLKADPAINYGLLKADLYPWYGSAALKMLNENHLRIQKEDF